MTRQQSFKRLVRARMDKTGERYATARRMLLAAGDDGTGPGAVAAGEAPLVTSDAAIRQRTGRGWEAWFDLLDEWGADAMSHRDIARRVAAELGIHPLAWAAQAVTTSYERARGMRVVGQRSDGFAVSASRTVAVPVEELYAAFVDESTRSRWLPDAVLRERTATAPTSARFDWDDDGSRVHATFSAKGPGRATVTIDHSRLPDAAAVDRLKPYWRAALIALRSQLERDVSNAKGSDNWAFGPGPSE